MFDIKIAEICHEANRAYCESIGDTSQVPWSDAPEWQKESALAGVKYHIGCHLKGIETSPADSHNSWLKQKTDDGWVYGEKKDVEAKTHPCCVEYDKLPIEQKQKDFIFCAIVKSFIANDNFEAREV